MSAVGRLKAGYRTRGDPWMTRRFDYIGPVGEEISLCLDSIVRSVVAPFTGERRWARAALGSEVSGWIAAGQDPLAILRVLRIAVTRIAQRAPRE